jgi:hypothetical protein
LEELPNPTFFQGKVADFVNAMISGNSTRVSRISRLMVEMNHITDIDDPSGAAWPVPRVF